MFSLSDDLQIILNSANLVAMATSAMPLNSYGAMYNRVIPVIGKKTYISNFFEEMKDQVTIEIFILVSGCRENKMLST